MKNKKIIFVQNVNFPQQWAVDIFYYSKYLSKYEDVKVKVIVSKISQDISSDNLEIIELWKINYFSFIWKAFFEIRKINQLEKIDYVYFFAQHPFSVLLQFFVKYFLKIKTIYDVVSWPIWKGIIPFISKYTIKLWVFLSDKYIVLDKWLIKKLHLSKSKKHEIVWMWYDPELFFEKKNVNLFHRKPKDIIFIYIWTLNTERNLDFFLKAFFENIKENIHLKLYFIWTGSGENILKEISWKYLNKNIFFLWNIEHRKIPDYINSSDVMVSYVPKTDYFEYQPPTKLIEYLACNKPVIATNTIAQCEILKWFDELIHKDDLESTEEKIHEIVHNISFLSDKNYKKNIKEYSWETLIKKIKSLIY